MNDAIRPKGEKWEVCILERNHGATFDHRKLHGKHQSGLLQDFTFNERQLEKELKHIGWVHDHCIDAMELS